MKKICWVFLILSLNINMISIDVYLPAMSSIASELSSSPILLKLIFVLNFLELSLAPLIWGMFSDIKGRRAALFNCMVIALIGQILSSLAPDVYSLMASRIIQFLGAGALSSIILALICDNFEGDVRAKAIALFEMALPFVMAIGPIIGANLLEYINWRGSFLMFGGLQIICFLGVWLTLPRSVSSKKEIQVREAIEGLINIFRDISSMITITILGLAEGFWMVFTISTAFFYIQTFNLSLSEYGYYQAAPILAFLLGIFVYRLLITKLGIENLFKTALMLFLSIGMFLLPLREGLVSTSPLILSAIMSLLTFCCGFVGPSGNALVLSRMSKKLMGTGAATITSIINLMVGITMLCGSYLNGAELTVNFYDTLLFILFVIGTLWLVMVIGTQKKFRLT